MKSNTRLKKAMLFVAALFLMLAFTSAGAFAADSGINTKPTLAQLRNAYNSIGTSPTGKAATYAVDVNTGTYTPATLTEAALTYANNYINFMRYQAGLGSTSLDDTLNANAAQGALIMARNDVFSHDQAVPAGITEEVAKPGRYATKASNISYSSSWPSSNNMSIIQDAILGQMKDDSGSNLTTVGHRRWLLKPSTSTFGIGSALLSADGQGWNTAYTCVRVMNRPDLTTLYDASFGAVATTNSTNYDFYSWPASGYMLNEVFDYRTPWSIHLNESKYMQIDESTAKVTVTRQSDNKSWVISQSSPNTLDSSCINSDYFKVSNNSNTGIRGEGHTLIFCPNPNDLGSDPLKGTFTVSVTGLKDKNNNDKTLEYSVTFADLQPDPTEMEVTLSSDSFVYTGQEIKPTVTVTSDGTTLDADTDYTVEYKDNINVTNAAKVVVTGKGSYSGEVTKTFAITPKSLTQEMVTVSGSLTYNGQSQSPNVTVKDGDTSLVANEDYTLENAEATNAGTHNFSVKGKGNYTGTVSKSFAIAAKPVAASMVSFNKTEFTYNGSNQKPDVTVKDGSKTLNAGTDYSLTNNGGTNVGNYSVTVTGKGNYTGPTTKEYTIKAASISGADITLSGNSFEYDGTPKKPTVTSVKLGEMPLTTDDYTVIYDKNTMAGTDAEVIVTGKGNYAGQATATFTITPKALTDDMVTLSKTEFVFNGSNQKPDVTVKDGSKTLNAGTDYELTNNGGTEVGDYKVTVTGKANYTGTAEKGYTIKEPTELDIAKAEANRELDAVDTSKYSGEDKTKVEKAIADARAAIEVAPSAEAVKSALNNAKTAVAAAKTDEQKRKEKEAADKAAAEQAAAAAAAAAEARARSVVTVTVNVPTVNAGAIDQAIRQAGGSKAYVTRIVLGARVKKISKNTFKVYPKVTVLELRTKKLSKNAIKGSLKGSAVKRAQVKVGNKKTNKKFIKKYKKIFTKKIAGKKVSVK